MDLTKIPLFAAMAKRMQWLSARQSVIAENVANANTPGFRASDLKPMDFAKVLGGQTGSLQLAATDPAHITASSGSVNGSEFIQMVTSPNSVSLEEQMMKVSQTATDYAFTTGLYQKQISLIKDAIGHGG